ncbi:MAG: XRE family transcriptional regulator [Ruminococcaceae bacterium]|nr:XRE family transcriptional regulator [Oscillospiraceae bacterium]
MLKYSFIDKPEKKTVYCNREVKSMFDSKRLGSNIRKERERLGMTQAQLAEKLYVSFQAVSGWERGVTPPEVENICKMAEIFGVSVDMLLFSRDDGVTYRIGIDGGGTKTEFLLFTETGEVVRRVLAEGSNPNEIGPEACAALLCRGIDRLLGGVFRPRAIFAGIAGGASSGAAPEIRKKLQKAYPNTAIELDGDFINILSLSEDPMHSMGIICGTGSNVFVRLGDKVDRIGGWGYLFDVGGSGFDIGSAAVRAALAARDGLSGESRLTDLVKERIGDVKAVLGTLYKEKIQYIASFAPLVFQAAAEGDGKAQEILQRNAGRMAELINTTLKKFNFSGKVIGGGGLMREPAYHSLMQAQTKAEIVVPDLPPVYGACAECCLRTGVAPDKAFRAQFKKSYTEITK